MATILDDLLIEILSRLPIKSLHRFQCVSKLWTNMITHISSKRKTLLPMSGFLFFYLVDFKYLGFCVPTAPEPLQFYQDFSSRLARFQFYSTSYLRCSCNGLFLFVNFSKPPNPVYYVCNPATNEFVVLPDQPPNRYPPYTHLVDFDPRVSPHYKVVIITSLDSGIIVSIYSSMTGRWTRFTRTTSFRLLSAVFHKQALYMISWNRGLLGHFDTDQGSFHVTMLPGEPSVSQKVCIGDSRGGLYFAQMDGYPPHELRIYMLDEQCTGDWLLRHKVNTKEGMSFLASAPLAFHPESELIYLKIPGKIISCHPSSGKMEEICSIDGKFANKLFPISYCLESLNPPGGRAIKPFAVDDK